jgi:hypothetical protein
VHYNRHEFADAKHHGRKAHPNILWTIVRHPAKRDISDFSVFAWVAFYHALAQEQGKTNWLSVASLQSDFQIECQHSQYLSSGQIDSKEHYWIL